MGLKALREDWHRSASPTAICAPERRVDVYTTRRIRQHGSPKRSLPDRGDVADARTIIPPWRIVHEGENAAKRSKVIDSHALLHGAHTGTLAPEVY